jgi:sec-independent protein translocase protein TatB
LFGIGFPELIIIVVASVVFLGPEKLPKAVMDIAKFIKQVKQYAHHAQTSIEQELQIEELKKEALEYKQRLEHTKQTVAKNHGLDELNKYIQEDLTNLENSQISPNKEPNKDV